MARYPRTCPNGGHLIQGPQHEYSNGRTGRRKCSACVQERHASPAGLIAQALADTHRDIRSYA